MYECKLHTTCTTYVRVHCFKTIARIRIRICVKILKEKLFFMMQTNK